MIQGVLSTNYEIMKQKIQLFDQKKNKNILSDETLEKCVKYGCNTDEFDKYLYSQHKSVISNKCRNWLKLTNMIEDNDMAFQKWEIRVQDIIDPSLNCEMNDNLFIPSVFKIDDNYNCKIVSDII